MLPAIMAAGNATLVLDHYAQLLLEALRNAQAMPPLTEQAPGISLEDAYGISMRLMALRGAERERIVGKKIGVTSAAVMDMLGVHQPDFGYLTDRMEVRTGGRIPIAGNLIQPRAEAEVAFVLKKDLRGPGVTAAQVLQATDFVAPCLEIVDSRIQDWRIKIQDTVADNASSGCFVLGTNAVDPRTVDLATCGVVMSLNGAVVSTGAGAAALGSSPVACMVWLANQLGALCVPLQAGELILSRSLLPLLRVGPGDWVVADIGGLGQVSVRFG